MAFAPLNRLTRSLHHPFPLLLYLEWVLLGIAALNTLVPSPMPFQNWTAPIQILILFTFAVMGLKVPLTSPLSKAIYTGLEFGLIGLVTLLGGPFMGMLPFLFLLLVIRSCLMFKLPGRLTVTLLAYGLFIADRIFRLYFFTTAPLPRVFPMVGQRFLATSAPLLPLPGVQPPPPVPFEQEFQATLWNITLNSSLVFGAALLFVLLLVNAMLSERQSRDKLAAAHAQLRSYALRIEDQATLQERNRIAREIHDSLGHALTALNIQMETAIELWDRQPYQAQGFLHDAKRLGSAALGSVRESVSALRSDPLQGQPLAAAIGELIRDFARMTGVEPLCTFDIDAPLGSELATAAYRIVQEGLTNTCKHAQATAVQLELVMTGEALHLYLEDNGQGFSESENASGYGLQGMRERTAALDGQIEIVSAPAAGCRIEAFFPIARTI